MHTTKRSRFSVPWSIQPPPSLTKVDCGVFIQYERAEPLKWTTRSPIANAFHPPQASNIPLNFRRHKQGRRSVPWPIHRTLRGPRRLIVVWLRFWTVIDGPIWSSHRDSARVTNPPAGRILPRICTPIYGAAAPLPVRIGPHPSTTTSIMVLRWGGRGGFALLHP